MKKFLALVSVLVFLCSTALAAGGDPSKLPQVEDDGYAYYFGEVGPCYDENGDQIWESRFDEGVIYILSLAGGVKQAMVAVNEETKDIQIVVRVSPSPNEKTAKDVADSAVRLLNLAFSGTESYKSPSKYYFGSLYDQYDVVVSVCDTYGNKLLTGAIVKKLHTFGWSKFKN